MANVIARARGFNKDGTPKAGEATRLGGGSCTVAANTWRTFTELTTYADGSGYVEVKQNGNVIHRFAWGSENADGGQ